MPNRKEEERWKAEMDAATLAEAGAIKRDSKRLGNAKAVAKSMAKDAQDRADAMKDVARSKPPLSDKQRQQRREVAAKRIAQQKKQQRTKSKPKKVSSYLKGLTGE